MLTSLARSLLLAAAVCSIPVETQQHVPLLDLSEPASGAAAPEPWPALNAVSTGEPLSALVVDLELLRNSCRVYGDIIYEVVIENQGIEDVQIPWAAATAETRSRARALGELPLVATISLIHDDIAQKMPFASQIIMRVGSEPNTQMALKPQGRARIRLRGKCSPLPDPSLLGHPLHVRAIVTIGQNRLQQVVSANKRLLMLEPAVRHGR